MERLKSPEDADEKYQQNFSIKFMPIVDTVKKKV